MPHMGRDEQTDASRTGRPYERAAYLYPVDIKPRTPVDDKRDYPDSLNATRGAVDIGET